MKHQGKYFDSISTDYNNKAETHLTDFAQVFKITQKYISGDIVDVGNGGRIQFDTRKAKSITCVDISPESLKKTKLYDPLRQHLTDPPRKLKIRKIVADARRLPLNSSVFSTAFLITTAHHFSEESLRHTRSNIITALRELNRVLINGKVLIIVETCPTQPYKFMQDFLFSLLYKILIIFGKPLPYFMSEREIKDIMHNCGFRLKKISDLHPAKIVYLPLFPSLSLPGWFWNLFFQSKVFIAEKLFSLE